MLISDNLKKNIDEFTRSRISDAYLLAKLAKKKNNEYIMQKMDI